MANENVATLFQHIAAHLASLWTVVGTQGISQIVHPFDGDSKIFKDWVRSIEKYALLTDDRVKMVAYQSSWGGGGGEMSIFTQRDGFPWQKRHTQFKMVG